jgi:hypothetical protein
MTVRKATHFEVVPLEVARRVLKEDKRKQEVPAKKAVTDSMTKNYGDALEYPDWQRALQEALVELDTDKLKARVATAEVAIFNRLQAISQSTDHKSERQAIEDALINLRVLKRESLGFPDWKKK